MYLNCLKNKKGQSLLTVLVVASVLIILAAALSESAFFDYTSTLADTNNNYAYNAAESAVEMCFDRLNQICGNESFASDRSLEFDGTNTKAFADKVVVELNKDIKTMKDSDIFQKINISDNQKNSAKTVLLNIQLAGTPIYDPPYMRIPVGLTAQATYDPTVGNPQTRQVYAKKEIKVLAFEQFKLRGAVYTIGDMVALPSSTTNIKGDVFVYGSAPAKSSQSEQDSYGGIIGKENSNLTIDGNAYSRSFIRTSGLDSTVPDNNIITIKKDAIAQSIQVFSKNSEIVVHRDAYTFDDLEMNGENSLIAINNNFFGLSKGQSFHDESSAVVNSASIYNDSDDSKKSRIVINGDVLINGGTFKFDPDTGETQGQIEDASVAWLTTTPEAILEKPLYTDWEDYNQKYDVWLRNSSGVDLSTIRGFGNIFQAWTPRGESEISQWLNDIKTVAQVGYNDFSAHPGGATVPTRISGFSNYEIAANDTMYFFTDNNGIVPEDFYKGLKKAQNLFYPNKFNLDLFYNDSVTDGSTLITDKSAVINYWKTFWDSCNIGWKGQNMYLPSVSDKLNRLSELLKAKAPFYKREEYQYLDDAKQKPIKDSAIVHKSNSQFQTLINQLTEVVNNHPGSPYIYSDIKGQITDLGSKEWKIPATIESDKLYLFVNTEHPDISIVIDGITVRGIIFTTGKVIVRNGGKLNGAVIAAGPGYINTSPYVDGSACGTFASGSGITATTELRVPRVTTDNKSIFEAGGYAAVQFENGSSTNKNEIKFVIPDFPDATTDPLVIRNYYINTFKKAENGSIDLDKILK